MERDNELEGGVMTLQKEAMLNLTKDAEQRQLVEQWLDNKVNNNNTNNNNNNNKDVRELA